MGGQHIYTDKSVYTHTYTLIYLYIIAASCQSENDSQAKWVQKIVIFHGNKELFEGFVGHTWTLCWPFADCSLLLDANG